MSFSGLFAYVSGSPLVFMDIFHVEGKVYGWLFAFLSIGLIGASQVNSRLLRFYQSEQIVLVALGMGLGHLRTVGEGRSLQPKRL